MGPHVYTLASALFAAAAIAQTPPTQCFWKGGNNIVAEGYPGWFACNNTQVQPGGANLCCLNDSECGEDSICHYPNGSEGGSGWFVGGCTDGSYNDPVCPRACTSYPTTYIEYNYTQQLWHCCGGDGCSGTPTDETFQAVAPEDWKALPFTATSSSMASTSTTSSSTPTSSNTATTGTSTSSPSPSSSSSGSGGLSTGAIAGIAVACAVVGLVILGGVIFLFYRRKRRNNAVSDEHRYPQNHPAPNNSEKDGIPTGLPYDMHNDQQQGHDGSYGGFYSAKDVSSPPPNHFFEEQPRQSHELATPTRQELPGSGPAELPAHDEAE